MKRLIIILFSFISGSVYAQNYPDDGLDKVRIIESDRIIQAEIKPLNNNPGAKGDRFYYWYSDNAIHSTQGGYSGDLLNGLYNEYYLNKNLKAQGVFKKGLKEGVWKSWKDDGTLSEVSTWKNGLIVQGNSGSIFEKVNIFKKKDRQTTPDSLSRPKN